MFYIYLIVYIYLSIVVSSNLLSTELPVDFPNSFGRIDGECGSVLTAEKHQSNDFSTLGEFRGFVVLSKFGDLLPTRGSLLTASPELPAHAEEKTDKTHFDHFRQGEHTGPQKKAHRTSNITCKIKNLK